MKRERQIYPEIQNPGLAERRRDAWKPMSTLYWETTEITARTAAMQISEHVKKR